MKNIVKARMPLVTFGNGDELEAFAADYLADPRAEPFPLHLSEVDAVQVVSVLERDHFKIDVVFLAPWCTIMEHVNPDADVIDMDVIGPAVRVVGGIVVDGTHEPGLVRSALLPPGAAPHVSGSLCCVRIAAGVGCQRTAGAYGAAWLSFQRWVDKPQSLRRPYYTRFSRGGVAA